MRRGRPPYPELLTPREQEVLSLLREGLTNEQIADRLGISRDGAKYHVSEILSKLGVSSRQDAARWSDESRRQRRWGFAGLGALPKLAGKFVWASTLRLAVATGVLALAVLALGLLLMESRSPAVDPGLGKVAYILDGNLWVQELPHGTPRQITNHGSNLSPSWSPSGKWLSVGKAPPQGSEFWVMREDGSAARTLDTPAEWSPVDDVLVFRSTDRSSDALFVVEAADGRAKNTLLTQARGASAAIASINWRPNGRGFALHRLDSSFSGSKHTMLVLGENDSTPREFFSSEGERGFLNYGWIGPDYYLVGLPPAATATTGNPSLPSVYGAMAIPVKEGREPQSGPTFVAYADFVAVSPDYSKVAVVASEGKGLWRDSRIASFDPATGQTRFLTDSDTVAVSPSWAPDSSRLAHVAAPSAPDAEGAAAALATLDQHRIWVMAADGSSKAQLTNDPRYRDERPQWSADGRHLLFVRIDLLSETRAASLWLLDLQTNDLEEVVPRIDDLGFPSRELHTSWDVSFDWWRP
jgi:Tol biopolymer transport system component/DNA-binding CsgD family transcriptional regulator